MSEPNSAAWSALSVCLVITVPCILASTALTGLPGITRGMKKSTVTAAIAVRR